MNDWQKAQINKLFDVEKRLKKIIEDSYPLTTKIDYTESPEFVEGTTKLRDKARWCYEDIGNVRCALYMEWNKEKKQ